MAPNTLEIEQLALPDGKANFCAPTTDGLAMYTSGIRWACVMHPPHLIHLNISNGENRWP